MKKGFTLLELLAVVVVLAIVALISIPLISSVIKKAKEGSAKDSVYGYIDAVEKSIAIGAVNSEKGIQIPSDNTLSMSDMDDAAILESVNIKGTKPEYAELTFEKSKVKTAGFCMDGFNFEYINRKVEKSSVNYCANASVKDISFETNDNIVKEGNKYYLSLAPGNTYQLNPTIEATEDGVTVQYKSNNEDIVTVSSSGLVTGIASGTTEIIVHAGTKAVTLNVTILKSSLVSILMSKKYGTEENIDSITIEGITYNAHVYYYNGNQDWTTSTVPHGGIFGNDSDIGTASTDAQRMVVVKVNGDLTIGSGVTITPYSSSYGGPKGFALIVTGTLTNNGKIDNSYGAKATGEKVYLWYNSIHTGANDEYEFVPAVGGAGGNVVYNKTTAGSPGEVGSASTVKRGTGGGGSGAALAYSGKPGYSGAGGSGTSYSGGTGGGGVACYFNVECYGESGSSAGGAGGNATANTSSNRDCRYAGGGAGNPGGFGASYGEPTSNYSGTSGTGGLLILYANKVINNSSGIISANGSSGGVVSGSGLSTDNGRSSGGSSGGGSINIFYKSDYINNNASGLKAIGGAGVGNTGKAGGPGGAGSITIGSIATGTFVAN